MTELVGILIVWVLLSVAAGFLASAWFRRLRQLR
jgi:hypothetical protein